MMMKSLIGKMLLIASIVIHSSAFNNSQPRRIEWNTLKVRWGPDPLVTNGDSFVRQPRTIQQAVQEQYKKLPTALKSQCIGKHTVGYRYWKPNDTGVILIYDIKGTISGIQLAFPQSAVTDKHYSFKTQAMYNREKINGVDMYTLTAYFVHPRTICTSGRTLSNLEHQGTGTGLFIQNGSNPLRDAVEIPQWETDLKQTNWNRGGCFPTMGRHYWYGNPDQFDCREILPAITIYNRGQLSVLVWGIVGKLNFSPRVEHTPKDGILWVFNPAPSCVSPKYDDAGGFTTMHIYFNSDPANLKC